jgi:hypothetical protein
LRAENDGTATDQVEDATPGRHIRWTEDVVDNEGMGKKSSKGKRIWNMPRTPSKFICLLSLSLLFLYTLPFIFNESIFAITCIVYRAVQIGR